MYATFIISKQTRFDLLGFGQICGLTQLFNHIPGQIEWTDKLNIVRNLWKAHAAGILGGPFHSVMLPTYTLEKSNSVGEYRKMLQDATAANSQDSEHDDHAVGWIHKKKGVENSRGITLYSWNDLQVLNQKHGIDQVAQTLAPGVLQRYMKDPLLLDGHKTDLRCYILISSVQPLASFFYPEFIVRRSPQKYSPTDKGAAGLTAADLTKANFTHAQWSPIQMAEYLAEAERIDLDPQIWLDTVFLPKLKVLSSRLLRTTFSSLAKDAGYYGIFGMDVLVTNDLEVFFSEMNYSPDLGLPNSGEWKQEVTQDMLREVMGIQLEVLNYRVENGPAGASGVPSTDLMMKLEPAVKKYSKLAYTKSASDTSIWWYDQMPNRPSH